MLSKPESVPAANPELSDMASSTDRLLDILFQAGHEHSVRTTAPIATEGTNGDIILVELSGAPYIYIKFPTLGWKRILAS